MQVFHSGGGLMFRNSIALIVIALFFTPAPARAQSSSLRGTVTDAQNALIPSLVVTATNLNTAVTRSTVSDEGTPVTNAFGALLGIVNQYSATYNYDHSGSAIAFGQPTVRAFVTKESEFYMQDAWKARRDLTLTYGLRYSLNG